MTDGVWSQLLLAVEALERGGVVAYPTEAVFGLGCNPFNVKALQRIIDIKGRDAHKGFIVIASQQLQLQAFVAPPDTRQQTQLDEHWPGPVTFVMPASEAFKHSLLSGYRDTLAVRVSTHPLVVALCNAYNGAIVSTSANISGKPALRSAESVQALIGEELDVIVDAPVGKLTSPTMIFNLVSGERLR